MSALMDLPITDAPMAFIDFELTGLREYDEPIEVAIVHLDPGENLPRLVFTSRVCATVEMSEGAKRITGLTDTDLSLAPSWGEVGGRVMDALEGRLPTAYNAPSDFGALTNAQSRAGDGWMPTWPWADPLVLVKHVQRYEKRKTLAAACARYGIALDAHGAVGDALATALLWRRLLSRFLMGRHDDAEILTVQDYLEAQSCLALAQEREFVAYVRRTHGTSGERPSCPWHMLEGVSLPDWPAPEAPMGACLVCGQWGVVYRVGKTGEVLLTRGLSLEPHVCEVQPKPAARGASEVFTSSTETYQDEDIPF